MLRLSMSSEAARSSEAAKDPRLIWTRSLSKMAEPRPCIVMERLLSPSLDSTLPGGTSPAFYPMKKDGSSRCPATGAVFALSEALLNVIEVETLTGFAISIVSVPISSPSTTEL